MSYHSKETDVWCECRYPELDEDLMGRTDLKLPKYKCKVCDLWWKNKNMKVVKA
tara:strand:+ start:369 stop:530 length:162 start_codon:yes stop_codon:yes gene_type:complete